jgi:hypothetical protein
VYSAGQKGGISQADLLCLSIREYAYHCLSLVVVSFVALATHLHDDDVFGSTFTAAAAAAADESYRRIGRRHG